MASKVSLLIVCVVDGVQTQDVLFGKHGAAQHMKAGQTVMLCPTISPEDVEVCAHKLAALGYSNHGCAHVWRPSQSP